MTGEWITPVEAEGDVITMFNRPISGPMDIEFTLGQPLSTGLVSTANIRLYDSDMKIVGHLRLGEGIDSPGAPKASRLGIDCGDPPTGTEMVGSNGYMGVWRIRFLNDKLFVYRGGEIGFYYEYSTRNGKECSMTNHAPIAGIGFKVNAATQLLPTSYRIQTSAGRS